MSLPWGERIAMLSINPDAARREDVAQLAGDLMKCRQALVHALNYLDRDTINVGPKEIECSDVIKEALGHDLCNKPYKKKAPDEGPNMAQEDRFNSMDF